MFPANRRPLIYLISSGELTDQNFTEASERFLQLVLAAVRAKISLIQIREKQLSANQVFALVRRAAEITRNTNTLTLVNDRADIALAARADGVHLTGNSLSVRIIRQHFPRDFVVGASCHALTEVQNARNRGADFATFSPIFATPSKASYNLAAQGVQKLKEVCAAVAGFPVIALGGIDETNFKEVLSTGASGVAAIRFLQDKTQIAIIAEQIRRFSRAD